MASQQMLRRLAAQRGAPFGFNLLANCQKQSAEVISSGWETNAVRRLASTAASAATRAHLGSQPAAGTLKPRPAARRLSSAALPQLADSESEGEDAQFTLDDRIGFVGAGAMGEALIRGFCEAGITGADRLAASVRSSERQKTMTSLGVRVFGDATRGGAEELAANSDIIVLGVKPVYMKGILEALAPHLEERHLVVSIAAGLKLDMLEAALPEGSRVVRVMPNTPCLIGAAASTYVMGTHANEEDKEKVDALMSSVGMAVCIEEWQMDAATALAGSGPAYVFQMLEAMSDGAVNAGLPRDKAQALATQTLIGAARMVFEASGDGSLTHPGVLKDRVTSPAGTTIAGIAELENSGVRGAYIRAIKAAANRSCELSKS